MVFCGRKSLLFFTKILIVLLTVKENSGIDQKISFFASDNCSGTNTSFGDPPAASLAEVKSSKSFLVETGAWRVYESGSETSTETKNNSQTGGQKPKGDSATKIWIANDYRICRTNYKTIEKIERIGGRDLESDSLALYPDADYMGAPTIVNDSQTLTKGVEINSWAITGEQNWAVYNETEYGGYMECLDILSDSKYSVKTWSGQRKGQILSVKKGCSGTCSLKALCELVAYSALLAQALLKFI